MRLLANEPQKDRDQHRSDRRSAHQDFPGVEVEADKDKRVAPGEVAEPDGGSIAPGDTDQVGRRRTLGWNRPRRRYLAQPRSRISR